MRFLANENIPGDAVLAVRASGHDIVWVREISPGDSDVDVIKRAMAEQRVLVLFRLPMSSPDAIGARIASILSSRTDWADRFWVVEPDRIRMRASANVMAA